MKTYWFTVAAGEDYQEQAAHLEQSLARRGIRLSVLREKKLAAHEAKHLKIEGLLDAPTTCERIVYLDADTLVLEPDGFDAVNGSWRIPWRIPLDAQVPKKSDPAKFEERVSDFYSSHGLDVFDRGGALCGVEWNSGVIAGDRERIIQLAREWDVWWHRVLDLYDGEFRRDQISYRLAYYSTGLHASARPFPTSYNWIASYFGINPNANVVHRTMVRHIPWLKEQWDCFVSRYCHSKPAESPNEHFDYSGLTDTKPDLDRRVSRIVSASIDRHLRAIIAAANPRRVLAVGATSSVSKYRQHLPHTADVFETSEPLAAPQREFDFVLFCDASYEAAVRLSTRLPAETVFCFAGLHDLSLYGHLFEFRYVRIVEPFFGIFANNPEILRWQLPRFETVQNA